MVLTVSFVLSLVTGLFCHHPRSRCESIVAELTPASGRQDHTTSPSASRAVRQRRQSVHRIPQPNVRDDRETPLVQGRGTARFMDLIWVKREAIYFCSQDWTGSISLIGNDELADWRKWD
jgi:hypothetical protein